MQETSELEEMLGELQRAGLLDSHGTFSIDFVQAARRLGRHLLPDARMYALRLFQSAVCSGSTAVHFAGNASRLHCRSWGPPVPLDQLKNLASYLLPDAQALAASYLATALQAALSLNPHRLQLFSWDGQQGACWQCVDGHESFQELHQCPFDKATPQTCLLLERRASWFFRRAPEWEWLEKHCGVGPIALTINGQPITPDFGCRRELTMYKMYLPYQYVSATFTVGGRARSLNCQRSYHVFESREGVELGDDPCNVLVLPDRPRSRLLGASTGWVLLNDGERLTRGEPVRSAIGIRADLRQGACVRFVRHGVMLKPLDFDHRYPGLDILAGASDLPTDLSGASLVEDEPMRRRCKKLLDQGESLWSSILEQNKGLDFGRCLAVELSGDPAATHGFL